MAEVSTDVRGPTDTATTALEVPAEEVPQKHLTPAASSPLIKGNAEPLPSPSQASELKRQRTDDSAGLLPNGLPTPRQSSKDASPSIKAKEEPSKANGIAEKDAKNRNIAEEQGPSNGNAPSTSGQSGPVSLSKRFTCDLVSRRNSYICAVLLAASLMLHCCTQAIFL